MPIFSYGRALDLNSGHLGSGLWLTSEVGVQGRWVSEEAGSEMVGICRRLIREGSPGSTPVAGKRPKQGLGRGGG